MHILYLTYVNVRTVYYVQYLANITVRKLDLNLKARSMSVTRVTLYSILCNNEHYSLLLFLAKNVIFLTKLLSTKNGEIPYTLASTHFTYVAHNFIVEFCHH